MLILPPGHAETVGAPRRLSSRELWMVRAVAVAVIALAAVLVISLATSGPSSGRGCLHLTLPAPTGAQEINQCGATARETCATATAPGSFTGPAAREVVANCRRAGLRVGG